MSPAGSCAFSRSCQMEARGILASSSVATGSPRTTVVRPSCSCWSASRYSEAECSTRWVQTTRSRCCRRTSRNRRVACSNSSHCAISNSVARSAIRVPSRWATCVLQPANACSKSARSRRRNGSPRQRLRQHLACAGMVPHFSRHHHGMHSSNKCLTDGRIAHHRTGPSFSRAFS